MKKILLTTAAIAVLATPSVYAAEGDFYGKANVGFSKFDKVKEDGHKYKSENTGFFGVAGGYYLMNNVRAELALDHFFSPTHKNSRKILINTINVKSKLKGQATTVLANAYVDLFDISVAQIFAGAGVGMSRIQTKFTSTGTQIATGKVGTISAKSKSTNTFAYALHLGASTEFAPGMHGELTYSYRDMGKTKKVAATKTSVSLGSINYKAHNVGVGVRFDF